MKNLRLSENGFSIKHMNPNILFISWDQWIPSYERTEYKKRTGITINEKGEEVKPKSSEQETVIKENKNCFLEKITQPRKGGSITKLRKTKRSKKRLNKRKTKHHT